jgi:hypothetical protein
MRTTYKICSERLKERAHLKLLGVDGRIRMIWILQEQGVWIGYGLPSSESGEKRKRSYEHGNKPERNLTPWS